MDHRHAAADGIEAVQRAAAADRRRAVEATVEREHERSGGDRRRRRESERVVRDHRARPDDDVEDRAGRVAAGPRVGHAVERAADLDQTAQGAPPLGRRVEHVQRPERAARRIETEDGVASGRLEVAGGAVERAVRRADERARRRAAVEARDLGHLPARRSVDDAVHRDAVEAPVGHLQERPVRSTRRRGEGVQHLHRRRLCRRLHRRSARDDYREPAESTEHRSHSAPAHGKGDASALPPAAHVTPPGLA